jgi:general nucleoside transport system ATP-binding protein
MPPLAIEMQGVVKRFGSVLANDNVNFAVNRGEIHALLGENGAGKSTLMQILYGLYVADEGRILIDGKQVDISDPADAIAAGIGMVHQEFMLVQSMSVVENVVLGATEGGFDLKAAAERLSRIARDHGLAVDPWARVEHLPIGVQQRVEILKLLYRNALALILDEPTAVLTPAEKEGLFDTLRSLRAEGRSVVIVTHKLHEIMAVADRVSVMRAGRLIDTVDVGDTSERDLARRMVGRDVLLRVEKPASAPGPAVLQVRGLALRDEAGRPKLRGVDLELRAGEILGVAGVDGNGQSELADALSGLRAADTGSVVLSGRAVTQADTAARRRLGLGFVPADRRGTGALTALSIADNAVLGRLKPLTRLRGTLIDRSAIARRAQTIVERFGVRAPGISLSAGALSGGNLQKLILGRELLGDPCVLIAEQPTRGLDVGSVEAVWRALLDARADGKAILLISAELEEVMNLSDRIAVMFEGRIVAVVDGPTATVESIGLLMAGGSAGGVADAAA